VLSVNERWLEILLTPKPDDLAVAETCGLTASRDRPPTLTNAGSTAAVLGPGATVAPAAVPRLCPPGWNCGPKSCDGAGANPRWGRTVHAQLRRV
jgi:hypothetical protein